MNWIKENWFKLGVLTLIAAFIVGYFAINSNQFNSKITSENNGSITGNTTIEVPNLVETDATVLGESETKVENEQPKEVKVETPKPVSIANPISKLPEKNTPPVEINYNEKSIISAKGVLAELQAFEKGNDLVIREIDERKLVVNNLLLLENQFTGYSDETMVKIHNVFVDAFKDDLSTMESYKNKFSNVKGYSKDFYPSLNTMISTYPNKIVSKEQSISDIQSHNKIISDLAILNNKTNELISAYYKYAVNTDNQYKQSIQMYIDKLKEITGSYVPNNYYVPATSYIPPIQLPKVTNCYIQGYGNLATIDCYTQ